jgi:competence protein ComEC
MKKLSIHTVPALIVAALLAVGILCGKFVQLDLWLYVVGVGCFVAACFLALFFGETRDRQSPYLLPLLILLLIFVGAAKFRFDATATPLLPDSFLKNQIAVIGRILESSSTLENRTRFLFQLETVRDSALAAKPTILVTVIRQRKDFVDVPFRYGNKIQLTGQLYRPTAERNPGEFNSRAYYEAQGISLMMRVRGYRNVAVLDSNFSGGTLTWMMRNIVLPVRGYIFTLIDSTVRGEEGELLKGILIGERGGIPYSTRLAFTNSGIAHILAVSGSNVVVVFAFFAMMFALLRVPRHINIILTALGLLFYMLLTGSQPPIVRATIMALVMMGGKLLGEKSNALNSLGVAALIIFFYDARQLFDVGFQLSFLAVFSLAYFFPIAKSWLPRFEQPKMHHKLFLGGMELVLVTFVATIGTLPLIAISFGRISIIGLLSNVIVVPLVGANVILGFVSSLFGWFSFYIADVFAAVNWALLTLCLRIAKFSGNLSWAYIDTLQFRPIHSIPFYFALLTIFHFHFKNFARKAFIGFVASLILLFIPATTSFDKSIEQKLRVSFIDVGQGDGALIEFPNGQTMLIDAGMKAEEYDAGERIIAPFLKRRGISTIDYFVASHPHGDHIGGAPFVFNEFDVGEVIESGQPARDSTYLEYAATIQSENCRMKKIRASDSALTIGGAKLYFLYPSDTFIDSDTTHHHENLNNTSVVLKLCFGETSVLFTGDAEREAEEEMVRLHGSFLASTILKAGHHGSKTSSTEEFVSLVKPKYAIISCGLNNKFNHPSEEVVERFRATNVETLRTDEDGAIIFETDGKKFERIEWR